MHQQDARAGVLGELLSEAGEDAAHVLPGDGIDRAAREGLADHRGDAGPVGPRDHEDRGPTDVVDAGGLLYEDRMLRAQVGEERAVERAVVVALREHDRLVRGGALEP